MQRTQRALLASVLALGLVIRIALVRSPLPSLVALVPDDACYYFQTARNIVAGNGSTFDGIHTTNGYHPLWMAVILPIVVLVKEPLAFLQTVLGLGVALSFLSALLVYLILRMITVKWYVQLLGVAFYFLSPQAIASSVNGLETSLATLLFTLLLYLIISEATGNNSHEVIFGLLLGLLFLARTDSIFYAVAYFLCSVFQEQRSLRLRRAVLLAASALLLVSPWLVWSYASSGSPIQTSGLAVPYVLHESRLLQGSSVAAMLAISLLWFAGVMALLPHHTALSLGALLICRRRWPSLGSAFRRIIMSFLLVWMAGTALVFTHTFIRWYPRSWYFDQLIPLAAVVSCYSFSLLDLQQLSTIRPFRHLAHLTSTGGARLVVAVAFLLLLSPVAAGATARLRRGDYPWQVELLEAAYWLRDNHKEGEVAAAFNAGILSFFSGAQVVNLDGTINDAAYSAIKRRDLIHLMKSVSASYYIDYDPAMLSMYSPFMGDLGHTVEMSPVQAFDEPEVDWNGSKVVVYKLRWLGAQ